MKMDNLLNEMCGESIEILGQLITTKVQQKEPEERRQVVNKIFDALYEPFYPKDERLERLIGFLRDMYAGLDEATCKSLTFQIQKICMDVRTSYESNNAAPVVASPLVVTPVLASPLLAAANVTAENNNNIASFADTPFQKWLNKDKKLGQLVRINVGKLCGTIAQVDELDIGHDSVRVKLADGKLVKYSIRYIDFLD